MEEPGDIVMAVMQAQNNNFFSGYSETSHSGFNGTLSTGGTVTDGLDFPDSKYYDVYNYSELSSNYFIRILGDATGEMGPFQSLTDYSVQRQFGSWYNDTAYDIVSTKMWSVRGAAFTDGYNTGLFAFSNRTGINKVSESFRIVLTPE